MKTILDRFLDRFFHRHTMVFTHVQSYVDLSYGKRATSVEYVKMCECGHHESGIIYGCYAETPEDLNLPRAPVTTLRAVE